MDKINNDLKGLFKYDDRFEKMKTLHKPCKPTDLYLINYEKLEKERRKENDKLLEFLKEIGGSTRIGIKKIILKYIGKPEIFKNDKTSFTIIHLDDLNVIDLNYALKRTHVPMLPQVYESESDEESPGMFLEESDSDWEDASSADY